MALRLGMRDGGHNGLSVPESKYFQPLWRVGRQDRVDSKSM